MESLLKKIKLYRRDIYEFASLLLVVLTFVQFFFAGGHIPSGSMEPTLKTGDVIIRNVMIYGGKTPARIRLPYLPLTVKGWRTYLSWALPRWRAPGYSEIKRGDIVTFEAPLAVEGDHANSYIGDGEGLEEYVKRWIASKKDTISIKNGTVFINGKEDPFCNRRQYKFDVLVNKEIPTEFLEKCTEEWERKYVKANGRVNYHITMTYDQIKQYDRMRDIHGIDELNVKAGKRPYWKGMKPDDDDDIVNDMKEITVPYKGMKVKLDKDIHILHIQTIQREAKRHRIRFRIEGKGDTRRFFLNGQEIFSYIYLEDYGVCMGDNFHGSADFRTWGFTPYSGVNAKVSFVLFSLNGEGFFYKLITLNFRWGRYLTTV